MTLCRLVYCSRRSTTNLDDQKTELSLITNISHARNSSNDVTGVLLSSPSHFFQILEGAFDPITATMSRIRQDARHDAIELLQMLPIEQRTFAYWAMAVVDLKAPDGSLTADLLNRAHAGERRFTPILRVAAFKLALGEMLPVKQHMRTNTQTATSFR